MLDFIADNSLLSAIIAFGLVLIPAIIIHELGHFLAAKAVGITVLEFGIGFPPRITRLFTWGETEFTLNWIPLGGFVRPLGEDLVRPLGEDEIEADREKLRASQQQKSSDNNEQEKYLTEREELMARGVVDMRAVHEVKPLPRIFFMAAGALANFISAILLFVIVGLVGLPQPIAARVQIATIPDESFLAQVVHQPGDAIERIDGKLFETPQDFFNILEERAGETAAFTILDIETEDTYTVEVTLPEATYTGLVRVFSVQVGSPAETAGVEPDDLVIAINGTPFTTNDPINEIQEISSQSADTELTLTILREGTEMSISLTPRLDPQAGEGRIGIAIGEEYASQDGTVFVNTTPQYEVIPLTLGESMQYGLARTAETLQLIGEIPSRLIQGTISAEEARPVSIIGISQVGGQILVDSIQDDQPALILEFMALISIFLGITNLLPIPALDGGRILFVLIEIIRGRPISPEREGFVHFIGIVFLLSLGVVIMLYDLFNPLVLPQ